MDRIGLWSAGDRQGGAALLSENETLLLDAGQIDDRSGQTELEASSGGWLRGDLSHMLLWTLLCVLVVECWLCHRHAVY